MLAVGIAIGLLIGILLGALAGSADRPRRPLTGPIVYCLPLVESWWVKVLMLLKRWWGRRRK